MKRFQLIWCMVFLSLSLVACDAGPSAVLPDGAGTQPSEQLHPKKTPKDPPPKPRFSEEAPPRQTLDTQDDISKAEPLKAESLKAGPRFEISQTRYGEWPLWSSNRRYSAFENATYHFEKHGADFGARTYEDWVSMVHAFIHNPPKGTETLRRNNGDTLFYNARQNIFAVMTKKGAPRTLFRPDDGQDYWERQKQKEATRRTITRDNQDETIQ
jgi:hypothetical protein